MAQDLAPESNPHWPSKSNVPGAHLPAAGPPDWGAQCGVWNPSVLGRNLYNCNCPPVCGLPTWGYRS